MQIVFIRHGEPDKALVDARGFIGQGRDLAPLTDAGIQQAEQAAANPLLDGCQLIVASPYTRALQTAAIISRKIGRDIRVEVDLHEFIPDKTFQVRGEEENKALHRDFMACRGEYPPGENRRWETIPEIIARTKPVRDRYVDLGYDKIAVVAHGGGSAATPAWGSSPTARYARSNTRRTSSPSDGSENTAKRAPEP